MFEQLFRLDGEISIITGGAGGIGKEIARALYEYGSDIIISDIDNDAVLSTVSEISQSSSRGPKCFGFQCDVTDRDRVRELCELCIAKGNKISNIVISHGIARRNFAEDMTEDEFNTVIDVNLRGVFLCMSEAGRYMIKQNKGNIICISSIAADVCMPRNVNYTAAKGGVSAMVRAFAGEWARYGVRVNAIAPGPCKTNFTKEIYLKEGYVDSLISKIPIGRIAEPSEMVGVALLLATQAGSNIVGQIIKVDGGYTVI